MAMNKREQAEMDDLREQLRLAKAMRFTERVVEDVPCPKPGEKHMTIGWMVVGMESHARAEPACSAWNRHGRGQTKEAHAQGGVPLFSSRLLALRAARNVLEDHFAKLLAGVDKKIEDILNQENNQS